MNIDKKNSRRDGTDARSANSGRRSDFGSRQKREGGGFGHDSSRTGNFGKKTNTAKSLKGMYGESGSFDRKQRNGRPSDAPVRGKSGFSSSRNSNADSKARRRDSEGVHRELGTKPFNSNFRQDKVSKQRSVELLLHTHADDGLVRLNKYLSHAGICSRREADKLIESGCVTVNGNVIKEMGFLVKPDDVVTYCGRELKGEINRYFLLNKPKGFITTLDDPQDRRTVMMLMDGACAERIYPVGRLDRNTTGLLLFTNDGNMAKKLTHPSSKVYKIYHVELDKPVSREAMNSMLEGLDLEDGIIRVDDVQYVEGTSDRRSVGVALHSGKNRIVRRIFEHLGYEVLKLDRVVFAGLTKKDLPRGRFRELTEKEVGYLKML